MARGAETIGNNMVGMMWYELPHSITTLQRC